DCDAWKNTTTCPRISRSSSSPSLSSSSSRTTCPEYFRWIHEDLKPWRAGGISKGLVEKAKEFASFRLVILNGRIYMEEFRGCFQRRMLFSLWGIVQLSRLYPGKLPDLELMFHCEDRPVVFKKDHPPDFAPPLFRYSSNDEAYDIPFPTTDFWGWPETNIKPWKVLVKEIEKNSKKKKWEKREPYAYWRGNPTTTGIRADLMGCNVTPQHDWKARLYAHDWDVERQNGFRDSNLAVQCNHRYRIYIDGYGWSMSNKYILACDSPALMITPVWYDFFSRGLMPLRHYWPTRPEEKCKSIEFAVEWGNNHTKEAKAMGEAGGKYVHEGMKMEYVYDYMLHLMNEYSKLLNYRPGVPPNGKEICVEALACPEEEETTTRKFLELSLEKFPTNSLPCELPPAYGAEELEDVVETKAGAMREVEAWEKEYW
ncbi:hypothetical protein M569_11049, partial [Genlisea aurea]